MPLARLRKLARYSFSVPWCVPQWGWSELAATLSGSLPLRHDAPSSFAAKSAVLLGRRYALPVARGRVAIELGLRAMGVRQGDDVVLPSYVSYSVLQAVGHTGARPVYADVGPALNVTVEAVLAALTPATRCVIVPHLFGAPAPIAELEAELQHRGIPVLDDTAQALGASVAGRPVGSFGACAIVTCGPAKPLAGTGCGALLTDDAALFERAAALAPNPLTPWPGSRRRVLRCWIRQRFRRLTLPARKVLNRFWLSLHDDDSADYRVAGASELEARIALVQLGRLKETIAERRGHASRMLAALGWLAQCNVVEVGPETAATQLALVLPEAGPSVPQLIGALAAGGVESQGGYRPCHYRFAGGIEGGLDYTERVWRRVLCIPLETGLPNPARLSAALARL